MPAATALTAASKVSGVSRSRASAPPTPLPTASRTSAVLASRRQSRTRAPVCSAISCTNAIAPPKSLSSTTTSASASASSSHADAIEVAYATDSTPGAANSVAVSPLT